MNKFDKVMYDVNEMWSIIASYFDVDEQNLRNNNKEDAVSARYCLVSILCEKYNDNDISKATNLSKSVVNKIRNKVLRKEMPRNFYLELKEVKYLLEYK
jgi:hypothetical protein